MNRRKFMIGFGGIVIGSGAVLGSGAFTSLDANRSASVAVAGDSTAYLGLNAATDAGSYEGTVDSNLVTMNGASELQIALDGTVGSGAGVNDEAVMQIGEITSGDGPDPRDSAASPSGDNDLVAFVISNQFGQTVDLTVADDETTSGVLKLPYSIIDTSDDTEFESGADLTATTVTGLLPSHEVHVVVQVDTETGSDLSGSNEVSTLTLSATPNSA